MSDQFKKFLILFPSMGVAVGVFWLLWFLLGVIVSGSGEPCYGCFVFMPIFFVPSVAIARFYYLYLIKGIISDEYKNSLRSQDEIDNIHKKTNFYFFYAFGLVIIQTWVLFAPVFEYFGEYGIYLMLFTAGLGFIYWPFIFRKQISLVKKLIFSALLFCSPIIVASLSFIMYIGQ